MSSSPELDALASGAYHLLAGKYFQLAAFVMLVYDHILTFDQEVDRIWKQKFSGASLLFFINRYVTPLQFIIILDAFHDPIWTTEACANFVIFEGASTVSLVAVCQLIMILRVYALWGRSLHILVFLLVLWAAQIAVSVVGLRTGFPVPLPPILTGCILTGKGAVFPSLWVAPLVTDSCIFILTIWRTREYLRDSGKIPTIHVFVRDGALYFFTIFMANLMNTLIFFLAEDDLKAIGASFSQLITAVMVSRLVLNLRSSSSITPYSTSVVSAYDSHPGRLNAHAQDSFMTRTLGNLGEELDVQDGGEEKSGSGREKDIRMFRISKGRVDVPTVL
ncbi:hypothetical protein NLJ89_g8998 [Agrocybe chaxingu]|uniref:DUF6533 domain-containing protein n=1 Tax=Agrocybe chaxingu TaxID=84603 RepID=A0A9W8JTK8_9AGAR|nr:hypothetical protein NLJ89_g8998 [Agrocybe chaxingu]